jgi:IS5 family transposase
MKKRQSYKAVGKRGFFDDEFNRQQISEIGNPLEGLSKVIDFEMFREQLEAKMLNHTKKSNVGPKPYDVVLMFKILILQRFYGLGDKQIEYQILDRTSFKQFLGLETGDKVPDEKTVWAFREQLTKSGLVKTIFDDFKSFLDSKGLIVNEGKMIDASFTVAPRQRNTREENAQIKAGKGDELWKDEPNKKRHKDIYARWTKKNNETFYGYKNHAKVDTKSKSIDNYVVTSASVHDSQPLEKLLSKEDKGQTLHADSAYTGEACEKTIRKNKMKNRVTKKGYKNKPLTDRQIKANHVKSKTRSRVEHVFGFMEQSMNGLRLRSVGLLRATGIIGLINLTYNLFRFEQVIRLKLLEVKG